MATYFLDTSALVKRYATEAGSAWVSALCDPRAGNVIVISQAALVETVAALCRKAYYGAISSVERDRAIGVFRHDARKSYDRERVTTAISVRAGDLCRTYNLRAYDAVQLACALTLRDRLAPLGIVPTFVTADVGLLGYAASEGLPGENPDTFP